MTKIVKGIVAGEIRCLVVWSLDCLATCVETVDALTTVVVQRNCCFYDRHDPVDIFSVEGRCRIYYAMAAAQTLREISHTDAKRYQNYLELAGEVHLSRSSPEALQGFRAAFLSLLPLVGKLFNYFFDSLLKGKVLHSTTPKETIPG